MVERNRNTAKTIGGTNVQISEFVDASHKRILITITNVSTSGQVINLAIGAEAKVGQGLNLAVGGYYQEVQSENFNVTQDFLSAISSAAGGIIAIQERLV